MESGSSPGEPSTTAGAAKSTSKSEEQQDFESFCKVFAKFVVRANRLGYSMEVIRTAMITQLESERAVLMSAGQDVDAFDERVRARLRETLPKQVEELKAKAALPAPSEP